MTGQKHGVKCVSLVLKQVGCTKNVLTTIYPPQRVLNDWSPLPRLNEEVDCVQIERKL